MKKFLAILLAGIMVLGLTACGQKAAAPAAEAPAATEAPAKEEAAPAKEEAAPEATEAPAAPVDDTVYTLVVTNHDASTSVGEQYVETLFNEMSEASGGRLQFVFNAGGSLFGGGEAVAAVKDGAADICWNATSITVGVFPVSEFINVPLNGITCARMGSKVLNDMIKEIPECADEYKDFHVVEVQACSTAPLSTVGFKIEKPEDFQGKSIRSAGTVQSSYVQMLGAAPSSMGTSEVYEALSKNVVSGMTNDWHNIDCFNLYEVVDYCMDYPINATSCFLLMNKDTYESLPADLQALIDSYSDYASDMAGYYWDCMRFITGDKMEANGVEIYQPSDDVLAFMSSDEKAEEMKAWYINYLNEKNLDGQAIWDKCEEIVARYADEYADPFAEKIELSGWDPACYADYQ